MSSNNQVSKVHNMEQRERPQVSKIVAIDIGGTHVKVKCSASDEVRRVDSGFTMTAERMVAAVQEMTRGWVFDVIAMGYPGPVMHGKIVREPHNLGQGWVGYDFEQAFGKPVQIMNDAAMQALGSYDGGRMLFLGLGTGLGSAMIVDGAVEALELGHLHYKKGRTYEEYVGVHGLERRGKKRWRKSVAEVIEELTAALEPDYVVIGGGNAKLLTTLPPNCRRGDNADAFKGGFRMWTAQTI